ncbi:hypothetical protein HRI_000617100 [Hibiscus trionum]|uniref:Pectinesterase inhibitor domain-containing protein n=1 Tax=Hibiscus trionum TaxID=183268 RepID=A0A9W7H2E4_HIBTR|nr:hypothetical protein HRI_000617100 [Hibiscus trionum]
MEIKPFILLISIFYFLHTSSSIRPEAPDAGSSTPESPDGSSSTPESPDASSSTPAAPDDEAPDADDYSPESPYASNDKSPLPPAEGPSATFSFTSNPADNNSPPELEKICQTTKLPIECVKYVSLFLNDSVKIEPLTVAMTAIRVSTEMTRQAIDTATRFMDEPGASDSLKEAMSTCLDNYQTIPDDNDLALQALDKRNPNEASFKLSSSLTSMDTCFDGITQMHITSPMRDMEAELDRLLRINLQLVSNMLPS